ncbi:22956_t:CDS:2 [Gigaspora rosea]|nr:22956_t:CDS:2 [Gigaspora rosea]
MNNEGKKRSRAVIACDECRKSKKKCIGLNQNAITFISCVRCRKNNIECIVTPLCNLCKKKLNSDGFCNCKKKRNPKNASYSKKEEYENVDENLKRLEKEIQSLKDIQSSEDEKFGRLKEEIALLRDNIKKVEEKTKSLEGDFTAKALFLN